MQPVRVRIEVVVGLMGEEEEAGGVVAVAAAGSVAVAVDGEDINRGCGQGNSGSRLIIHPAKQIGVAVPA